jgi:Escherichia/Staphylococcus phage prohead protease
MLTKALPARVKALEGDETPAGTFEAVVAAYNVDSMGDKIVPGAFKKTLAAWQKSGDQIPVIWSHQHTDAFAHIGSVSDAAENDDGLVVKGVLDIEDNPVAAQVYKLIKGGRIRNYSFAYDINDAEDVSNKDEGDKAENDGALYLLKELTLIEVGPCLVGANRETRTLDVKAGRTLSAANETAIKGALQAIQDAVGKLQAVIGVKNDEDAETASEDGKTQTVEPATEDEEPEAKAEAEEPEAKSEEPTPAVPVESLDAELQLLGLAQSA